MEQTSAFCFHTLDVDGAQFFLSALVTLYSSFLLSYSTPSHFYIVLLSFSCITLFPLILLSFHFLSFLSHYLHINSSWWNSCAFHSYLSTPTHFCKLSNHFLLFILIHQLPHTVNSDATIGPPSNRSSQSICEPGYYCTYGVRAVCTPGYWGLGGETASNCSGICTAGTI